MQAALDESNYRRNKQEAFNKKHNITPKSTKRDIEEELKISSNDEKPKLKGKIPKSERDKIIKDLTKQMHTAAKALEFEEAARLRDEITKIRNMK